MAARWGVPLGILLFVGCETPPSAESESAAETAAAWPTGSVAGAARPGQFHLPPRRGFEPNPLGLPAPDTKVQVGSRVFAVPRRMLATAELGHTLHLRGAEVEGTDGPNLVVKMGREAGYPVHPAYVVVPHEGPLRRRSHVLTADGGRLRPAVVEWVRGDRITVRRTDGPSREVKLRRSLVYPQRSGLQPGSYAIFRDGEGWSHALLVSQGVQGDNVRRWLVLGRGGEARLVEHEALRPMPQNLRLRAGTTAWVAWRGRMVPAHVQSVDRVTGLATTKRARSSRPRTLGWGLVMPPLAEQQ